MPSRETKFRVLSNEEKEAELNEHIPHRMRALSYCELACILMHRYGTNVPFTFRFGAAPDLAVLGQALSSRTFTNPIVDSGIIHARVVFSFLGIKVSRKGELSDRTTSDDERVIEQFGLEKLTLEVFKKHAEHDPEVLKSVRQILLAANKSVAHHADNDLERTLVAHLYQTAKVGLDYMKQFYAKLNRPPVTLFDVDKLMADFSAIETGQRPAS